MKVLLVLRATTVLFVSDSGYCLRRLVLGHESVHAHGGNFRSCLLHVCLAKLQNLPKMTWYSSLVSDGRRVKDGLLLPPTNLAAFDGYLRRS